MRKSVLFFGLFVFFCQMSTAQDVPYLLKKDEDNKSLKVLIVTCKINQMRVRIPVEAEVVIKLRGEYLGGKKRIYKTKHNTEEQRSRLMFINKDTGLWEFEATYQGQTIRKTINRTTVGFVYVLFSFKE